MKTAVIPGTFDPFTLGHLDVIDRGSRLFDHLVIGIGVNPNKEMLFNIDEHVKLTRLVVASFKNVSVEPFGELAVQFVRAHELANHPPRPPHAFRHGI